MVGDHVGRVIDALRDLEAAERSAWSTHSPHFIRVNRGSQAVHRPDHKTLATFKATAAKNGKAKVTFHLSRKLAAEYRGKKLTLRLTVTDANGHKHTITKTLKLS